MKTKKQVKERIKIAEKRILNVRMQLSMYSIENDNKISRVQLLAMYQSSLAALEIELLTLKWMLEG